MPSLTRSSSSRFTLAASACRSLFAEPSLSQAPPVSYSAVYISLISALRCLYILYDRCLESKAKQSAPDHQFQFQFQPDAAESAPKAAPTRAARALPQHAAAPAADASQTDSDDGKRLRTTSWMQWPLQHARHLCGKHERRSPTADSTDAVRNKLRQLHANRQATRQGRECSSLLISCRSVFLRVCDAFSGPCRRTWHLHSCRDDRCASARAFIPSAPLRIPLPHPLTLVPRTLASPPSSTLLQSFSLWMDSRAR